MMKNNNKKTNMKKNQKLKKMKLQLFYKMCLTKNISCL